MSPWLCQIEAPPTTHVKWQAHISEKTRPHDHMIQSYTRLLKKHFNNHNGLFFTNKNQLKVRLLQLRWKQNRKQIIKIITLLLYVLKIINWHVARLSLKLPMPNFNFQGLFKSISNHSNFLIESYDLGAIALISNTICE